MTIQSNVNDGITYSGNDSATTCAFPFKVDLNTQIEVIIRDALGAETTAVLNTDYTVAGFTVEGSGVVTYPISGDPLATGKKITIKPKMDFLQSTDIRNQGRFAPEINENAFDTLMMHIKELKGEINRTIQFKKSSDITGAEFGVDPDDNKLIAWDGVTGKTKNVVSTSALVTTFWEAILAYTTAAASRADLDAEQIINSLTAITSLQNADQFGIADNSDSDNSKKITFQNLAKALINGLTAITTLQDSDQISIADNSDSDNSKKITFANFILQALLDEDDMASNSATRGATQQSIKAYADNIPMFRAYMGSAQTIANVTTTKLQFNTESFDTNSWYDNSTNYRYTPLKAGKYLVTARLRYNNNNVSNRDIFIYKNGSGVAQQRIYNPSGEIITNEITTIADMNGSTDYLEAFSQQSTGGNADTFTGVSVTEFSAIYIGV
jgi:hypothetical protein